MSYICNMVKKLLFIFFIFLFSCNTEKENYLTIAAASNVQFAMEEIITSFSKQNKINCKLITGSSGKLTSQIKEGAPFHVFLSADLKFPKELYNNNLTTKKPEVYAYGNLVLCSYNNNRILSLDSLTSKNIKHIGVANYKTAPYGKPAIEVLIKLNIFNQIRKKLVYGENISQTNQFITSKAVEVAFTSKSTIINNSNIKNYIPINPNLYSEIKQGIVILNSDTEKLKDAQKFYNFIFSKEGKNILKRNGYTIK